MQSDFYPGSKKSRKEYDSPPKIKEDQEELELGKPKVFLVNGQPQELYPLGALAIALNRKPVTIRKLEQDGIIPKASLILPSNDPRGQRRLYTRAQIEALRTVAAEEGVLEPNSNGKWKAIEGTKFREKALIAFKEG